MASTQEERRTALAALLARYEHDDPDSVPVELGRYALVQRFGPEGEEDGFWLDFGDEPEDLLALCQADFGDSGYQPFLLVDLDTGQERPVEGFSLV